MTQKSSFATFPKTTKKQLPKPPIAVMQEIDGDASVCTALLPCWLLVAFAFGTATALGLITNSSSHRSDTRECTDRKGCDMSQSEGPEHSSGGSKYLSSNVEVSNDKDKVLSDRENRKFGKMHDFGCKSVRNG